MSRRKIEMDVIIKRWDKLVCSIINKPFEILSVSIPFGNDARIEIKCIECGGISFKRLDSVISGCACRSCSSRKTIEALKTTESFKENMKNRSLMYRKSHDDFEKELSLKSNGRISILSEYKGGRDVPTEFRCNVCKYTWVTNRAESVLTMKGCPGECHIKLMSIAKIKPEELKLSNNETIKQYRKDVKRITEIVYTRYKTLINPMGLKRTYWEYQLDHIYTVSDGFHNPSELDSPITLNEICHPANLQMLTRKDNSDKSSTSHHTLDELRYKIKEWDDIHGNPFIVKGDKIYLNVL